MSRTGASGRSTTDLAARTGSYVEEAGECLPGAHRETAKRERGLSRYRRADRLVTENDEDEGGPADGSVEGTNDAQVVAPGGDLRRGLHAARRRDDRQRGAARHGAAAAHDLQRPAVGHRPVCPCARRAGADRRGGGGPVRPPQAVPHRAGALRRGVAHLRPRAERRPADRRARRPGRGRGGDVRDDDGADQQHLHRARARHGLRHLGRGQRRRVRRGADHRRAAHGQLRLAVDLPGQPAGQRRRRRA